MVRFADLSLKELVQRLVVIDVEGLDDAAVNGEDLVRFYP